MAKTSLVVIAPVKPSTTPLLSPKKEFSIQDLKKVHKLYKENVNEWDFLLAVYDGVKSIIAEGLIKKHEREPQSCFTRRMNELYGFDYSKSVIEIFHFHLFKKQSKNTLGNLHEDPAWKKFQSNADLYGSDYVSLIMDIGLNAAIQGHMGILVDKSSAKFITQEEQLNANVYPYMAVYYPSSILDWEYSRNDYGVPYLSYLKLLDDDGLYHVWYEDQWELWKEAENKSGRKKAAELVNAGVNLLGLIPFVWYYNLKSRNIGIGLSDIHGVARIDLSIIRNMSQVDQIINFAAFPMMRKPLRSQSPSQSSVQQEDEVGVESILQFDPDMPDSKPDWLEAVVEGPIRATMEVVVQKIAEIFRTSNIGGMAATEPTANPQSGVSKKIDFQLLNSKLVNKAINLESVENQILRFWCMWEGVWDKYKDIAKIVRDRNYNIEDLASDLENAMTSKTIVLSSKFNELVQKRVARQMLISAQEKDLKIIDQEIESGVVEEKKFKEASVINMKRIDDEEDEDTKKIINKGMEEDEDK